jgi:hypothetical protein
MVQIRILHVRHQDAHVVNDKCSCIADWRFREFYPCRKFHLQILFYVLFRSNFNIFVTVGKNTFLQVSLPPNGRVPSGRIFRPNRNIWQILLRYIVVVDGQGFIVDQSGQLPWQCCFTSWRMWLSFGILVKISMYKLTDLAIIDLLIYHVFESKIIHIRNITLPC